MNSHDRGAEDAYAPKTLGGAVGGKANYPSATQTMPMERQNLNGLIMDRRAQHYETVARAYENLSIALDQAADDGFDFSYIRNSQENAIRSMDATVPTPVRIPRSYEIEISSRFNPPI